MRVVLGLMAMTLVLGGCSGASRSGLTGGDMDTVATVKTTATDQGLVLQQSDLDGNGKPDVYTYFREKQRKDKSVEKILVKKSMDLNGDGRLDVTQHYEEDGSMAKEELDLDFDGRIDALRNYEENIIKSEQVSSLFDGRFDVRKFYENGVMVLKLVDTRRTGTFDEFQYFVGNKLSRIGWDHDGDGKPEVFEDNPAVE